MATTIRLLLLDLPGLWRRRGTVWDEQRPLSRLPFFFVISQVRSRCFVVTQRVKVDCELQERWRSGSANNETRTYICYWLIYICCSYLILIPSVASPVTAKRRGDAAPVVLSPHDDVHTSMRPRHATNTLSSERQTVGRLEDISEKNPKPPPCVKTELHPSQH